tara:strand:- start:1307 stop:1807 length:501 start_codon:yes stop_codon:yes gene_type:complete
MINQAFKNKTYRVRDAKGVYRSVNQEALIQSARSCIRQGFNSGPPLSCPGDVTTYLQAMLAGFGREIFSVLLLNQKHELIAYEELFQGTIDGASVYPREVVKLALHYNAAAAIFAHNHPSGNSEPSAADKTITERLKQSLALIDVRVLDHIVVGERCTSLAEQGLL